MSRITARRRPTRGVLLVLLLVLLLVVVLVADRATHARTEARISGELARSLDLQEPPAVTVDGFPFLTQVAAGRLGSVRAQAEDVTIDTPDGSLGLHGVRAHARDVTLQTPSVVGRLELGGTLRDASIQNIVGRPGVEVATRTDGIHLTTEILGLRAGLVAVPEVTAERFVFRPVAASLAGNDVELATVVGLLPPELRELEVDVSDLPMGLRVTAADPVDGGLRLALTGTDLTLEE
ncbi:DUF2993 domain-containing protein [Georgenia alba]|uniref:DUF2993 domain-containing protein n=1 Tax=Georgenia alba TaxID=2233858 RepID=A0ABW2Q3T3_9MICO